MSANASSNETDKDFAHRQLNEREFMRLMEFEEDDDFNAAISNEGISVLEPNRKELVNGVFFNIYPIELLPEELVSMWDGVVKQPRSFVADEHCVKEIYEHLWTYWITTELCRLIYEEMSQCRCDSCDTCLRRWDLEHRVTRLNVAEFLSYQYLLFKIETQISTSFNDWLPNSLRSLPNPYTNPTEKGFFLRELPVSLYAEFPNNKRIAKTVLLRRIHHVIDECTRRRRE
jgi:hypothetical protein